MTTIIISRPISIEDQIRVVAAEVGSTPDDHVTQDPGKLYQWGVKLATLMISMNTDLIRAERAYNHVVRLTREQPNIKTKADADIVANDTNEWEQYRRISDLMKSARELLMVVKKFQQQFADERQFAREMQ